MDFSEEMMDEIFKIFQVESEEIISRINNSLLDLEQNPNNKDAILMLFRDAHTLKGASRMVGFNNVQTVAHKMEDILDLAKENKLLLNSDVVDVLYKIVDFLSDIIQKSIAKGHEVYSEDIAQQIAALECIEASAEIVEVKNDKTDFNAELFLQNIDKINRLITESLFVLMKLETQKNSALIANLLLIIKELYKIFGKTGPYDIKKLFEDIKVKLEFTTRGSNNLTNEEIENIHRILDNIIGKHSSIGELYNLAAVDYYSLMFDLLADGSELEALAKLEEEIAKNDIQIQKSVEVQKINTTKFDGTTQEDYINVPKVQSAITDLFKNGRQVKEIQNYLIDYEKDCSDNNIKNILQKAINILAFAGKNEIQLDEDAISILQESIEYCDNTKKNGTESSDAEVFLQRLEILQQVLEINENEEKNNTPVTSKGFRIKNKKIANFSDVYNSGIIKTLRVDSSKLDTLVNQVSELRVAKIKTKKHLHELNIINEELEEWQKNSVKVLNYLKYYDKKYFQSGFTDNSVSFFIKQLLNLVTDNNKKVQESVSTLSNLHRTIQEDDTKMNLVVDNLNNMVKDIRVLPLATVFHLFGRMVRDIAQEKNKKIELEIIGSETCTDKKIIEEIKTPLIHIIRNAIDHGIETPEEREVLGKNPEGRIILSARQVNDKVIIEIKDDGRGINLGKIKEKAIKEGYLTKEEINSMSDEQIVNIIFSPGFSTGKEITNISGRGIGLDVVQSKIAQLNGRVKVLSAINKGCCVQIELPTTMSTVKVFLVKSSNQQFAIPMDLIKTVMQKKKEDIIISTKGQSIIFNGETMSLQHLSHILNLPKITSSKNRETILIIESDDRIMALAVDKLIGDQEILHKKLSLPFYKLKKISGITTLASGEICFILNIQEILHIAHNSKMRSIAAKTEQKHPNSFYKILLVDDSITTRTLEKNILSKVGYNIEIAKNPMEAFGKMKNNRFDLIVTDVEMPEMNGFEFVEKLKTDEMFFDIPIIMLSSLLDEEKKKLAIRLGVKKYINKHEFEQDDFQETVNSILHKET